MEEGRAGRAEMKEEEAGRGEDGAREGVKEEGRVGRGEMKEGEAGRGYREVRERVKTKFEVSF